MKTRVIFKILSIKKPVSFLFFFISAVFSSAQINISTPYNGAQSFEIVGNEYIHFLPGFGYQAQGNNKLHAYIDPYAFVSGPAQYQTNIVDPLVRELDQTLVVGSTPASTNVSLTGGAVYSISIFCSPGTAGMQPNIALVYNSQGGNGIAGYGWNISGASSITRVPKTIIHDGEVKGVNFNGDRFALDGQRLMLISGNYGEDGSEYYTEVFNGSKIILHDDNVNGFQWFEVLTKDGKTIEYGKTQGSKFLNQFDQNVISWNVNKITDANGNYIEFYYAVQDLEFRLVEIKYTGNNDATPALEPYNSVKFFYTERADKEQAYINGCKIVSTSLLSRIEIRSEKKLIKTYTLKHYFSDYSMLNEVEEYGSDGTKYNSLIFGYEEKTPVVSNTKQALSEFWGDREQLYYGDFNGDGLTDVFVYTYEGDKKWKVLLNNGSIFIDSDYGNLSDSKDYKIAIGDFNGDGLSDVQLIENDKNHPTQYSNCSIIGLYSNGTVMLQSSMPVYTSTSQPINIFAADIDGNGQDEIVTVADYGYLTRVRATKVSVNISNFSVVYTDIMDDNGISPASSAEAMQFYFLDADGDGKSELIAQRDDQNETHSFQIYKPVFNGTEWEMSTLYDTGFPSRWHKIYFGDFNGDGKTDVLTWVAQNGWSIDLFNGTGFSSSGYNLSNLTIDPTQGNTFLFIRDFNNDGKSDIVCFENMSLTKRAAILSLHNGVYSFDTFDLTGNVNITNSYDIITALAETKSSQYQTCDFNGDGNEDIGIYYQTIYPSNTYGGEFLRIIVNQGQKNRKLISSANGLNVKTKYNYSNLVDNTTYKKGTSNINGCMVIKHPSFYVLKSVETDDGTANAGFNNTSYFYEGAVIHREGKGFLGFKRIITQSSISPVAMLSIQEINPNLIFMQPVLDQTYKTESGNTVVLSKTTYSNTLFNDYPNPKIYLPYTILSVTKDYMTNTKTEVETSYISNLGNIETQYQRCYSDTNSITPYHTTNTLYQNYVSSGSWCLSKPQDILITQQLKNESAITNSKHIQYDSKGNITSSVDFSNMPKAVTTAFTINDFGLPEAITVTSTGLVSRTSLFEYDENFRFTTKATDPEGYSSTSSYDGAFGNILSETDQNNLTTKYQYGAFGELIKTISPEGNWVNTEVGWNNPQYNYYCFFYDITSNISPKSTVTYDRFGRKVHSQQTDKDGNLVAVKWVYNNKNQLTNVSDPIFVVAGVPSHPSTTVYVYDEYGRLRSVETPNGVVITTTYPTVAAPSRTTTTTNLYTGVSTSQTKDAAGNITTATDPGGTITYSYYSDGNTKSISAPDGSVTSFTFDEYGRQKTLTDPDAGLNIYVYNAFGELAEQTDANGNHFKMTYDKTGRLIEKECLSDGTITSYVYNDITAQQGSRGVLAYVSFTDDNSKTSSYSYSYDEYSRLQQKTITIDQPFVFHYTYTSSGELENYSFPDGFSIKYQYDNNGFLTSVLNSETNEIIYAPGSTNQRGQLLDYTIADGQLFRTMTYDAFGFPINIEAGSNAGGSNIQNLQTQFDQYTGNLLWRKDLNKNLTESFSYDNVHHNLLTGWSVNGQQPITMSYNSDNGNILTKSDVTSAGSQYQYDISGKPHALVLIPDPVQLPAEEFQSVDYNCFNSVEKIAHATEQKILKIQYGPDEQRIKTDYYTDNTTLTETKYFVGGDFEVIENHETDIISYHHYLPGGGLYVTNSDETENMYYVLTDYQGNWNKVIAEDGSTVEEYSFDPWGRRRNSDDWTYSGVPTDFVFDRGYTGHEHLDEFGLINMNGRMYDPVVARFLSPDNFVQTPFNSHSFNRYSYCMNNPLIYTDPSGEFLWYVPVIMFAAYNGAIAADQAWRSGQSIGGGFAKGFAVGAISGLVGTGFSALGQAFDVSGLLWGAVYGSGTYAVTGALSQGVGNLFNGQDFWEGAVNGAKNGALFGALAGGVQGYISAKGFNRFTGGPTKAQKQLVLDDWDKYKSAYEWGKYNTGKYGRTGGAPAITEEDYPFASTQINGTTVEKIATTTTFSRTFVKMFVRNSAVGFSDIFPHEGIHAWDYYSGIDSYYRMNSPYSYKDIMEYRAYSFQLRFYDPVLKDSKLNLDAYSNRMLQHGVSSLDQLLQPSPDYFSKLTLW